MKRAVFAVVVGLLVGGCGSPLSKLNLAAEPTLWRGQPGTAGEGWQEPMTGMEFMWVPGGCFQMGSGTWMNGCFNDELPVHEVCVDGFWMAKTEVTQGQWKKVMGNNPSRLSLGSGLASCLDTNCPVNQVSWNDAKEFARRISAGGREFRLPTEAEWEYACRSGGRPEIYAGGNDVDRVAWYGQQSVQSQPVATKAPNALGLYDMSGSVWEWCEDVYHRKAYRHHAGKNPLVTVVTGDNAERVLRGGCWLYPSLSVRCTSRHRYSPDTIWHLVGLRLVRTK